MKEGVSFLYGYLEKQLQIIRKLHGETVDLDLARYENRYVFALKTLQLYTAIEDLFKQTAKAFENQIEDPSRYHRELLKRMNIQVVDIRPAVVSDDTTVFLDKLRRFRHFVRHAYSFEFDIDELEILGKRLASKMDLFYRDIALFKSFLERLLDSGKS